MNAVEHVVSINGEILNIPEHYQYNLKPSFLCKNLAILSYTLSLSILEQIQNGVTELSTPSENNVKGQSPFAESTGALLLQERELLLQSVLTSVQITWTHQCESILGASARSDSKKKAFYNHISAIETLIKNLASDFLKDKAFTEICK